MTDFPKSINDVELSVEPAQVGSAVDKAPQFAAGQTAFRHRSEVDGLRAVAVIPVILYHAGFGWFSGGFVGVDIFFVISGYLITSILIEDLETGKFSIARFYERRARRILPALFFVLLCCLPLAWFIMIPSQVKDLSGAILSVVFFVSNFLFRARTDYFAPAADENPLLHTWSLAVEEQFYVFFPILLWLLWRFGRRNVFAAIAVGTVASLLFSEWAASNAPIANFFLLPSRAWELGFGAMCALALRYRNIPADNWLALAGLGLISVSIFAFDGSTPFPSFAALLPVGGTALIILFARRETWVGRLLSAPAIVGIGLISYSAYLWHVPLLAFARIQDQTNEPPLGLMAGLALLSLGLAALSWRFVEQPFRTGPNRIPDTKAKVFGWSAAATLSMAAVAVAGILTDGFHNVWLARHPSRAQTLLVVTHAVQGHTHLTDGQCRFNVASLAPKTVARIERCHARLGPGILILGDSHSIDLYNGIVADKLFPGMMVIGVSDTPCRLHEPDSDCGARTESFLASHPGYFPRLYYVQAGFHLLQDSAGRKGRDIISGIPMTQPLDLGSFQVIGSRIAKVADSLDRLAKYTNVVWIGPKLEPQLSPSLILRAGCGARYRLRPGQRKLYASIDAAIAQASAGRSYRFVSQQRLARLDMSRDYINCSQWYWRDGDHWSLEGTKRFTKRLASGGAFN